MNTISAENDTWKAATKPKIAALIPTFNRAKSLTICLQCLREQNFTDIRATLLPIVIVDGSTDGTLELLKREFPEAVVILGNGDWWYTKCINEGIKTAIRLTCDFVLTLNDDLSFATDYVSNILRDYYSVSPGSIIGCVSLSRDLPRIITFSGVSKISYTLKEFNYIPKFSPVSEEILSGIKESVLLSGRGILFPIGVFEQLGLYDEKLVQYSAETDFTYTAHKKGIPVMISYNAIVYENVNLTSAGAVYNNPSLKKVYKSFQNNYSINSFRKIWYYSIKHRGRISGCFIALLRTAGVLKNYIQIKLKTKG
ncbi:MAG TPA: glycosyltransferase family 2 protein [Puia sp.]